MSENNEKCPTCHSNRRRIHKCAGGLGDECPHGHDDCFDSWHDVPEQPTGSPAPSIKADIQSLRELVTPEVEAAINESRVDSISEGNMPRPSCTLCGAAMEYKCLSCGSTPACVDSPTEGAEPLECWNCHQPIKDDERELILCTNCADSEHERAEGLQRERDELLKVLKDACDRDWKDETPLQVVTIAANAIHWRGQRAEKAEVELATLRKQVQELELECAALRPIDLTPLPDDLPNCVLPGPAPEKEEK